MKITVVRHGQTNYNVLGLHNSDPSVDVFLTERGINEAKKIGELLKEEPFEAIYISELPRTRQTAEYINKHHNLNLIVDARLNDINTGFEGKKVDDYHAIRNASPDIYTFRHGNAESSEDVYKRTEDFLGDLLNEGYKNVLIVTSKHVFRHFRNIIDQLDPREALGNNVQNAEILVREINN